MLLDSNINLEIFILNQSNYFVTIKNSSCHPHLSMPCIADKSNVRADVYINCCLSSVLGTAYKRDIVSYV